MSAPEQSPTPRRVFSTDVASEQIRIAGGAKATEKSNSLLNIPGVAEVFETPSSRTIEPSERLSDLRLRIENKLNGDDLRRCDKRRHALSLTG